MRRFTLPLSKNVPTPINNIKQPFVINAMLDTGALFPIWITYEEMLEDIGGILVEKGVEFGGMTLGNLYRIPVFRVGDLMFPDLPIIASRHGLPCQMLVSATMFGGLIYEVDDHRHRLSITIPDGVSHIRKLFTDEKMHIGIAE